MLKDIKTSGAAESPRSREKFREISAYRQGSLRERKDDKFGGELLSPEIQRNHADSEKILLS